LFAKALKFWFPVTLSDAVYKSDLTADIWYIIQHTLQVW
jgi:hypothetical protein